MLEQVVTTCMDIPKSEYGHLPKDRIYEWAAYQAALSVDYTKTKKGASATPESASSKKHMLERLKTAFKERGNPADWNLYKDLFDKNLEDPGTLENFRYFCVPDSDEMIMFYVSIWTGDMASAMEYLHRWGKNLKGEYRNSPENEAWYRMTEYEGIAVNERLKAQGVADIIYNNNSENICFFGGGNIPEKLYDSCLLDDVTVVLFETGKTASLSDLEKDISSVTIYQENLLQADTHQELLNSQDLIVMHGVSMYLGQNLEGMIKALDNGKALLVDEGLMSYDYLLLTDGMKRTATAQHWPNAEKMKIFTSVEAAISEGKETVGIVNKATKDHSYFDIESIIINSVAPWGETSVRFLLRKYA